MALAPHSLQAAQALNNRGVVLELLRRDDEALASYDRAIALNPGFAVVHNTRGVLLERLGRTDEALISYEKSISCDSEFPEPYCNRGNILKVQDRWDEALANYDRAIDLKPSFAEAHNNRGILLVLLHRYDEALVAYDRALAAKPDYDVVHYNKSLILLLLGDYPLGWRCYEWRWKADLKDAAFAFAQPLWLGDRPLGGRTLLLHAEQGLGDVIQMARYAPMAEALGAKVVLALPVDLIPLLRTLEGEFTFAPRGGTLPPFDLYCPMMSLPLAFKTTVDTIPAPIRYLRADSERQALWRERLGVRNRARVGLAWSGNPQHKNDRNRSLSLRTLSPLLALGMEFHSLQKEVRAEDQGVLTELPQLSLHADELGDFADTAALIAELDLVITVDTAVAHLAGALGKAVWILLSYDSDFRWMTERSDSPWYPTARLFRQPRRNDWPQVIAEVGAALSEIKI